MDKNKKTIVFTGGGSGGHVFPAFAIIEALKEINEDCDFHWIGSKKGIEKELVLRHGNIKYHSIPSGKLRRYFSFRNFTDLFAIFFGLLKSRRILKKIRPTMLFSKGGFVTVPPVYAAKSLKIKIFTHDSDLDPGLATKLNGRVADKILVPYDESLKFFSSKLKAKCVVSGNPVRKDIYNGDRKKGLEIIGSDGTKPVLFVMGGSLGAESINKLILNNLDEITSRFYVIHQMGGKNFIATKKSGYKPVDFIHEGMADIMAASDLALCRAGANSLWEFATSETPMILLPLIVGARGDQVRNSRVFDNLGCSITLSEDEQKDENFINRFIEITDNYSHLKEMAKSSRKLREINCSEKIASMISQEAL